MPFGLPDNYRKATGNRRCSNCCFVMRGKHDKARWVCRYWQAEVRPEMTCNHWRKIR